MTSSMPKLFLVNLDRQEDRLAYMWDCLERLGLAASTERFPAIDATKVTVHSGFQRKASSGCFALSPSEVAIWATHRAIWQMIVDQQLSQAIILEDDLVFWPGFKDAVFELAAHASDYDVIKLDGIRFTQRFGKPQAVGTLSVRSIHHESPSTAAYMISFKGAKRLLAEFETYDTQVDLQIFLPRPGWRMLQLYPAIAVQGMFLSEADRDGFPEYIVESMRNNDPGHRTFGANEPWWFTVKRKVHKQVFQTLPWELWGRRRFLKSGGTIEQVPLKDGFAQYKQRK